MSDAKVTFDVEGNTSMLSRELDMLERRVDSIASKFANVTGKYMSAGVAPAEAMERAHDFIKTRRGMDVDRNAYNVWKSRADRRARRAKLEPDPPEVVALQKEIEYQEKEEKRLERVSTIRGQERERMWRKQAKLDGRSWSERTKAKIFGEEGTARRRYAGYLGGVGRVIGGVALGAAGGGGALGLAVSALLGPLGALGGAVSGVVGMIMRSGNELVSNTRAMLGEMKQYQVATGGNRGYWQADAMSAAQFGMSRQEFAAAASAATRAAGGRVMSRFGNDRAAGSLARMGAWGIGGESAGRYAGLSRRYGISQGGILGAERLAAMFQSVGLQGPEALDTVTKGYEAFANQGLNVDDAAFSSFAGRALNNDVFASEGRIRALKGLQGLEGQRGGVATSIKGMFQPLAQSLAMVRALRLAGKNGATGLGMLGEALTLSEEGTFMGAEGMRDEYAAFGPELGSLLTSSAGKGFTYKQSRALMEAIPTTEAGSASGQLDSPYDSWASKLLNLFNMSDTRDIGRMGDADDMKEIVKFQQTLKDASIQFAKAANTIAGAANALTGK